MSIIVVIFTVSSAVCLSGPSIHEAVSNVDVTVVNISFEQNLPRISRTLWAADGRTEYELVF